MLSKDVCFVKGFLFCRRIYVLSKDVCFVEGCLPVPRVQACSSGASLFLACKPVPRVQACSSRASLFLACKPAPRVQACSSMPKRHQKPCEGGIEPGTAPGSDPLTSRGPNPYANPAPESRVLSGFLCTGNTSPGRAVRANCRPSRKKHYFLKFSTPNIPKPHLFTILGGKTHSTRGGNRTGYRPVPTSPQAADPTTMLIPPRNPAFSVASNA